MPTFSHASVLLACKTGERGGELIGCLTRYLVMCPSGYLAFWEFTIWFAGEEETPLTGEGSDAANRERRGITASAEELSQPITLLKDLPVDEYK